MCLGDSYILGEYNSASRLKSVLKASIEQSEASLKSVGKVSAVFGFFLFVYPPM
jgi:hypothetical protein